MASINKVILIGNLGKDPEVRYTPDNSAITNITLATTYTWKDRQTGDKKEETEWHRVAFFGRLAEVAGEYLKKGSPVYVEGRLRTRKWQDKEGKDRYTTEIVAENMQMLGSRSGMGGGDGSERSARAAGAPGDASERNAPAAAAPGAASAAGGKSGARFDDFEDDIPF